VSSAVKARLDANVLQLHEAHRAAERPEASSRRAVLSGVHFRAERGVPKDGCDAMARPRSFAESAIGRIRGSLTRNDGMLDRAAV